MIDLQAKTILLTGASSGIGASTARVLGAAGASLIAHYAGDREGVEQATAAIEPDRKLLLAADFTEPGSARRLWREAVAWRGRVDVLVNNAAIMPETPIDADDDEWDAAWAQILQVNVVEPASLMREAVRHFRGEGGGILISMSSWAAQQGSAIPQLTAYASTKAAVKAMTQTLARAHAKEGVLAYVIAPGIVNTRLSKILSGHQGRRGRGASHPAPRRDGAPRGSSQPRGLRRQRAVPPPVRGHARHQRRGLRPLRDRRRTTGALEASSPLGVAGFWWSSAQVFLRRSLERVVPCGIRSSRASTIAENVAFLDGNGPRHPSLPSGLGAAGHSGPVFPISHPLSEAGD